jgi:prepilin-type N-terminal cleavage/methylation domain-containing protein
MTDFASAQRGAGGPHGATDSGFSLIELLVSTILVLIVFGGVTTALNKLSQAQRSIWNRTELHSGVRGATELLQQEVGQAGRVALPAPVTLTTSTDTMASLVPVTLTVGVSSTAGMFVGEQLAIDTGDKLETVTITALDAAASTITATFDEAETHGIGSAVQAFGGFSSGIVPPSLANGSTGSLLKLYGDINADNNMVYVEYTCDLVAGNLYRNVMPWNAANKPAVTSAQVLLQNIVANPGGTDCFTYETAVVDGNTYVLDVAITLTVQTQLADPVTKLFQTETKALLNVAPRNVFHTWELASIGLVNRVQPMPPSILALLQ